MSDCLFSSLFPYLSIASFLWTDCPHFDWSSARRSLSVGIICSTRCLKPTSNQCPVDRVADPGGVNSDPDIGVNRLVSLDFVPNICIMIFFL